MSDTNNTQPLEHWSSDDLEADADTRHNASTPQDHQELPHDAGTQSRRSMRANCDSQPGPTQTGKDATLSSGGKGGISYIAEPLRALAVPVGSLAFDAANARKHGDRNMEAIKSSLTRWGQRIPIVVQRTGMIVRAGNGRLAAAKALGWSHIAAVVVDDSSIDAVAFAIADNRTAELAEWDDETLATLLNTLPKEILGDTGFGQEDLDTLLSDLTPTLDVDADPQDTMGAELKAKWGVATGQVWKLGNHRLACGDCTDASLLAALMQSDKADMCITDPPYGVAYVGKTKDALVVENDDQSPDELKVSVGKWFDAVDSVTRDGAYWVATVPARPLHSVFLNDWLGRGILRQVLVWNKDSMVLGHSEYHYKHEPILFGWKPGKRHENTDRTKTSVWDFARPKRSAEHPTMKPVEMWVYAIKNHTNIGDICFEPFSGSGTSIIACEQSGRVCRAVEISPEYVAVAIQRWVDATGGTPELV